MILDTGLALTLALLVLAVFTGPAWLAAAAFALHMLLRIYDGRFGGWRTASWLAFVLVQVALFASGFLGYVLPWGQLSFWLAAKIGVLVQFESLPVAPVLGLFVWATFFADVVALHTQRLRRGRTWLWLGFEALALALPFVIHDVQRIFAPSAPAPDQVLTPPPHILPDLGISAGFAVLRAIPDKPLGIGLLVLLLLLPATAPWMRAWRFHAPRIQWTWLALVAGLAACWVGRAVLGLLAADPPELWIARGLVTYEVMFFTAVPFVPGAANR